MTNPTPIRAAKSWFCVRAAAEGRPAVVEIYDEIGGWGIDPAALIEELQRLDAEGAEIEIRLNSPGGDVFGGYAICAAIARMKARTVAVVDGLAASVASVIACAADAVRMPANSMMMIHNPWIRTVGTSADLRASAEVLDKVGAQMRETYESKRARTLGEVEGAEDFAELMSAETWLTASEAAALGLCDEVLDRVEIAACVRPEIAAWFQNAEAAAPFIVSEEEAPKEAPGSVAEPAETSSEDSVEVDIRAAASDEDLAGLRARAAHEAAADADEPAETITIVSASGGSAPASPSAAQRFSEIRARQFARLSTPN